MTQPMARPDDAKAHFEEWFETSIVHPIEDFQDPQAGVAAALLGAVRHVLPRARGGGRRDDEPGVPGHDQPQPRR